MKKKLIPDLNKKNYKECSIAVENTNISCYSTNDLKNVINHLKKKKEYKKKLEKKSLKSKKEMYEVLKNNLSKKCGKNETCWVKHPDIKDDPYLKQKLEKSLKPTMPSSWIKDKFTWLSSLDIYKAMKQYEKVVKDFVFLGPVPKDCPIGYQCILSNLNPKQLIEHDKKNKIGIIYNLDLHDEPGSHWVAIFMDLKKGQIEYYDSYGILPDELIYTFMKNFAVKLNNYYSNKKTIILDFNQRRHQYGGSECGMFSMIFILERLQGTTLNKIEKMNITDKIVNQLRFKIFRKP